MSSLIQGPDRWLQEAGMRLGREALRIVISSSISKIRFSFLTKTSFRCKTFSI